MCSILREVPRHICSNTHVIKETLNLARRRNGNVTIPDLGLGESHYIVFRNGIDGSLDFVWS